MRVAADYANVLVGRMDQLRAQTSIATTDSRAYAVHQNEVTVSQAPFQ